jgi:hypothetical protein
MLARLTQAPSFADAAAPQVRAGGVAAFTRYATVLACPRAWGGGSRGYYEVEVLEMGSSTQAKPCPPSTVGARRAEQRIMGRRANESLNLLSSERESASLTPFRDFPTTLSPPVPQPLPTHVGHPFPTHHGRAPDAFQSPPSSRLLWISR